MKNNHNKHMYNFILYNITYFHLLYDSINTKEDRERRRDNEQDHQERRMTFLLVII